MRTVDLVTAAAGVVGAIATIVAARRRKPGPGPLRRWQDRRAAANRVPDDEGQS
jgi:hypothetical protein